MTGIDFESAKTRKDLFKQMKTSLKKFHGRTVVSVGEEKMRFDPALVANVAQALIAQGWKKPQSTGRRRSNTDPGEVKKNSNTYKGKKNPLGPDGKPRTCFTCGSEYHFKDKCNKNENLNDTEISMFATSIEFQNHLDMNDDNEFVMITDTEEQLCLMVVEAGVRGVIDSACSKTVAGVEFILRYISKLPTPMRDMINKGVPSKTLYQFGSGEQRHSLVRLPLPCWIGNLELNIETEVVDADIPLLIGANSLLKSKARIDFGNMKATFFETEVRLMKVGSGHFCISLILDGIFGKNITHAEETMYTEEIIVLGVECEK